jgi:nitrogen fixation-related uncharacterized protein
MEVQSGGLWDKSLVFVGLLGLLFFGTAVYAFVWARRQRQFSDFDKGARSIFDEEEPEGRVTDQFPADAKDEPVKGDDSDAKQPPR